MICRVCSSSRLDLALALPDMPWANNFLTAGQCGHEKYYPLRVVHCADCQTAQLDYTVSKETMFADHTYRSGTTKTLSGHFNHVTSEIIDRMPNGKSVLDIGSNDGTFLKAFMARGWNVVGVESSAQTAKAANDAGVNTLHAFFNEKTAQDIGIKFDVIHASGVFFHLEELHSVCEGIKLLLDENGLFVVQFIYAKTMLENGAFDQIYHEHLLYYTLQTIETLLNRHNLYLLDAYLSPIHGGSIIAFVSPRDGPITERLAKLVADEQKSTCNSLGAWRKLGERVEEMKADIIHRLLTWRSEGKRVYGLGAPVKGNTLLNTFGIGPDLISCLTERNEAKGGLYAPGSHIPVVMESEVPAPDVYFVLSWNFKDEILERNADLITRGVQFYFPIDMIGACEEMY